MYMKISQEKRGWQRISRYFVIPFVTTVEQIRKTSLYLLFCYFLDFSTSLGWVFRAFGYISWHFNPLEELFNTFKDFQSKLESFVGTFVALSHSNPKNSTNDKQNKQTWLLSMSVDITTEIKTFHLQIKPFSFAPDLKRGVSMSNNAHKCTFWYLILLIINKGKKTALCPFEWKDFLPWCANLLFFIFQVYVKKESRDGCKGLSNNITRNL